MIFIYSILLPRYLKLTGSRSTTVLLGALSYAALHVFEYWTVYDSVPHATLSVIFAVTTFFGGINQIVFDAAVRKCLGAFVGLPRDCASRDLRHADRGEDFRDSLGRLEQALYSLTKSQVKTATRQRQLTQ